MQTMNGDQIQTFLKSVNGVDLFGLDLFDKCVPIVYLALKANKYINLLIYETYRWFGPMAQKVSSAARVKYRGLFIPTLKWMHHTNFVPESNCLLTVFHAQIAKLCCQILTAPELMKFFEISNTEVDGIWQNSPPSKCQNF